MTVIFGVNLSDRVYLAGDSRISDLFTDPHGNEFVIPKNDNILKVDLVKGNSGVVLASAGDANFAGHILNKLYKEDFSKQGIKSIRHNIKEWIGPVAHDYFTRHKYTTANFIFAGSDITRKKEVKTSRILSLAQSYLKEGTPGTIKTHLVEVLKSHVIDNKIIKENVELSISDTVLFSLKISGAGIEIEDTAFGQFLLYGPAGLVKEDLEEKYIGQLEYAPRNLSDFASDIQQDLGLIIGLLYELAQTKQLDSVGGSIIPIGAFHDGMAYFIDGEVQRVDLNTGSVETVNAFFRRGDDFYRVDENGAWRKMIRVADYKSSTTSQLLI